MLQAIGIGIPFNRNAAGAVVWTPAALFASGEQGVWYDPSDFSTMFLDSAGTTPVTAVGQPVGKILDKSGRGNHASQATAASRPLLQQDGSGNYYLAFDGVDDTMFSTVIDFSSSYAMTWFTAAHQIGAPNSTGPVSLGAGSADRHGGVSFFTNKASVSDYWTERIATYTSLVDTTAVIGALYDFATLHSLTAYSNGVGGSPTTLTSTAYPLPSDRPISLGILVSVKWPGRLYGTIARAAITDSPSIANIVSYLANKSGVTLP